jgi:hypothetical protein
VATSVGEGVDGTEVSSVSEAPLLFALSVATEETQDDVDEEVRRVEDDGRPFGVAVVGWHLKTWSSTKQHDDELLMVSSADEPNDLVDAESSSPSDSKPSSSCLFDCCL